MTIPECAVHVVKPVLVQRFVLWLLWLYIVLVRYVGRRFQDGDLLQEHSSSLLDSCLILQVECRSLEKADRHRAIVESLSHCFSFDRSFTPVSKGRAVSLYPGMCSMECAMICTARICHPINELSQFQIDYLASLFAPQCLDWSRT